jgi:ERCC4-type nuclease
MILVDNRIGSKHLKDAMPRRLGVELTQLDFGDVAFFGKGPKGQLSIGVEIKTMSDALSCMKNGRLACHQIPGMIETFDVSYLLLIGMPREDNRGYIKSPKVPMGVTTLADFRGWLLSITHQAPVRLLQAVDKRDSIMLLIELYQWWQKDWAKHKSYKVFNKSGAICSLASGTEIGNVSKTQYFASQLTNVGWELSLRIAERFSTVKAMVDAQVEDWVKINGIGAKKAERIMKELGVRGSNNGD